MSTGKRAAHFLTREELALVERRASAMLGEGFMRAARRHRLDFGESLRVGLLTGEFVPAREKRGLTLKAAVAQLRVPQYRLRDVELGRPDLQPELLARYVEFLGLTSFASSWAARFPGHARRYGLGSLIPEAVNAAGRSRRRCQREPSS